MTCCRIALKWEGPFRLEEIVNEKKGPAGEGGLYQIYGTHTVFGRGSLLYIGKTETSFSSRFSQHEKWLKDEYDNVEIFLGVLIDEEGQEERDQHELIMRSEKMLIYYCSPPYNSSEVFGNWSKGEWKKEYILYNFGRIGVLPPTVSSHWYFHEYWEKEND